MKTTEAAMETGLGDPEPLEEEETPPETGEPLEEPLGEDEGPEPLEALAQAHREWRGRGTGRKRAEYLARCRGHGAGRVPGGPSLGASAEPAAEKKVGKNDEKNEEQNDEEGE